MLKVDIFLKIVHPTTGTHPIRNPTTSSFFSQNVVYVRASFLTVSTFQKHIIMDDQTLACKTYQYTDALEQAQSLAMQLL